MVGSWDLAEASWTGLAGRGEGSGVGAMSTDRLMVPALHTIEFALSLPALGKGLSWELSWTPRATGPGSAKPDHQK